MKVTYCWTCTKIEEVHKVSLPVSDWLAPQLSSNLTSWKHLVYRNNTYLLAARRRAWKRIVLRRWDWRWTWGQYPGVAAVELLERCRVSVYIFEPPHKITVPLRCSQLQCCKYTTSYISVNECYKNGQEGGSVLHSFPEWNQNANLGHVSNIWTIHRVQIFWKTAGWGTNTITSLFATKMVTAFLVAFRVLALSYGQVRH